MFFLQNCQPEVLQKLLELNNEQSNKKKLISEEIKEIKKMNEYKKLLSKYHKNINQNNGFSMSGMMYYGNILGEYNRLKQKYSDKEDWDIPG